MKKQLLLPAIMLLVSGCSDSTEPSQSEQLGEEIADKMRAPIEDTRAITEKIRKNREMPLIE